jgi:hypothetical protein
VNNTILPTSISYGFEMNGPGENAMSMEHLMDSLVGSLPHGT